MIAILPISLLITYYAQYALSKDAEESLFKSSLIWNGFLFAVTEVLSLLKMIDKPVLFLAWLCYCVVQLLLVVRKNKIVNPIEFAKKIQVKIRSLFSYDLYGALMFICVGLSIVMFVIAILTPPNNWDSLTYHLSRVMNWMQNKSVNYYPSCIKRCLYCSVYAEYVVLHTYELSGSEMYVNLVQWFAYIYNGFGIFYLCKKIGSSRNYSIFAVFLTMTLPMAIAQSCSTQTDILGALWLIVFLWYLLDIVSWERLSYKNRSQLITVAKCALAVGFGYATKGTVCFIMIGFLLYLLVVRLIRRDTMVNYIVFATEAIVSILPLVLPKFIRDKMYFGYSLSNDTYTGDLIGTLNPKLVIVNVYKNLGIIAARPHTSKIIGKVGYKLARLLKVDLDSPLISLSGDYANGARVSFDKDYAPNSVVFLTFIIAFFLMICCFRGYKCKEKWFYVTAALSSGLICVAARYTEWNNRYMIPALYLMAMVIVYVLERISIGDYLKYVWVFAIVLFAFMDVYFCVEEQINPVKDFFRYGNRADVYFRVRGNEEPYNEIYEVVRKEGYKDIGLLIAEDTFEYPIWTALKNDDTNIYHAVDNIKMNNNANMDCIIAIDQIEEYSVGDSIEFRNYKYNCIWRYDDGGQYAVFEKDA